ncbi:MAG: selenium-dependent molybdenum cofactor biosynthesis protein YqeB [Nitrospinota bacterium]
MFEDAFVVVRGAGDIATGVIHRLVRSGFPVIATEIASPSVIRRTVAFAEAVLEGECAVEGMTARRADDAQQALRLCREGLVPVVVDPQARIVQELKPFALVDAILAKRNVGTRRADADVVIGLGPGFVAGEDADVVIETNRGHDLARLILEGSAEPNTGVPGNVGGHSAGRVLRAPCAGVFRAVRKIADRVKAGEAVAEVDGRPVVTAIEGVLRGLLRDGMKVEEGFKVGDVDPRCRPEHCFTISDKARAIGGGVLEALLMHLSTRKHVAG